MYISSHTEQLEDRNNSNSDHEETNHLFDAAGHFSKIFMGKDETNANVLHI